MFGLSKKTIFSLLRKHRRVKHVSGANAQSFQSVTPWTGNASTSVASQVSSSRAVGCVSGTTDGEAPRKSARGRAAKDSEDPRRSALGRAAMDPGVPRRSARVRAATDFGVPRRNRVPGIQVVGTLVAATMALRGRPAGAVAQAALLRRVREALHTCSAVAALATPRGAMANARAAAAAAAMRWLQQTLAGRDEPMRDPKTVPRWHGTGSLERRATSAPTATNRPGFAGRAPPPIPRRP